MLLRLFFCFCCGIFLIFKIRYPQLIQGFVYVSLLGIPIAYTGAIVKFAIKHTAAQLVITKQFKAVGSLKHRQGIKICFYIFVQRCQQIAYFSYILHGKHLLSRCLQEFLLSLHASDITKLILAETHILTGSFTIHMLIAMLDINNQISIWILVIHILVYVNIYAAD